MRRTLLTASLLLLLGAPALADADRVLVRCDASCDRLAADIQALGGEITHRYRYIDALAATVPADRQAELFAHPDAGAVYDDAELALPEPMERVDLGFSHRFEPNKNAPPAPSFGEEGQDFLYNTALTGAGELHLQGHAGDGTVVAVIDSGIVNRPGHVLYGKVLGGENLVPGDGEPSATSRLNWGHGTAVACMIAAEGAMPLPTADPWIQSLATHAPESVVHCDGVSCPAGWSWTPVFGTAPQARLYAIKVSKASEGAGSTMPLSRLLAALERPITLKRNYDAGVPSAPVAGDGSEENPFVYDSLNVRAVNLSTGSGTTLYAGHQLKELAIAALYDAGILPVTAAGNDGPAAMTVQDYALGHGALTVGAAFTMPHGRVFADQFYGPGLGALLFPADHPQMADFSSRGPSADGRRSIDVVANGGGALVQGPDLGFYLDLGTSLSAPTVAGAAALLFGAVPGASAAEVRAALVQSADPDVLGDGSARIDQGHGFIALPAALALLQAGGLDTTLPRGAESATVAGNIAALGVQTLRLGDGGRRTIRLEDLRPGQVAHLFVDSGETTDLLRIRLRDVEPELPPGQQNVLQGDGIDLVVVDAPTSLAVQPIDGVFVTEGEEYTAELEHPQSGLVRIAVAGSATNAGRISVEVVLEAEESPPARKLAHGRIEQDNDQLVEVEVPLGTARVIFELAWQNHWGAYPTDNLDFLLIDPVGVWIDEGFTVQSPERVVIDDPLPGVWLMWISSHSLYGGVVHGVHGGDAAHWTLRVTDGNGDPL